ncbi:hypothetical protein ACFOYW_01180 [Gryllotalpicola reticulitermitis]|uniref:Uncharacterized protein n=1 Tax=Gryllotalpicola reticulitermitis TaxID=1184153 RepID=A0ABV8Q3P7_9MICO
MEADSLVEVDADSDADSLDDTDWLLEVDTLADSDADVLVEFEID